MSKSFSPIIDRAKETITVSRAFQIAAGNIGSAEHQEYLRMTEQYPGFRIEIHQKSRKKAEGIFGDLTYDGMKDFIKGYEETDDDCAAAIKELDDMRALYKGQRGTYLKVKEWFLTKYKDEFDRRKAAKEAAAREKHESNFLFHPVVSNN